MAHVQTFFGFLIEFELVGIVTDGRQGVFILIEEQCKRRAPRQCLEAENAAAGENIKHAQTGEAVVLSPGGEGVKHGLSNFLCARTDAFAVNGRKLASPEPSSANAHD